jgi:hypothetical protein
LLFGSAPILTFLLPALIFLMLLLLTGLFRFTPARFLNFLLLPFSLLALLSLLVVIALLGLTTFISLFLARGLFLCAVSFLLLVALLCFALGAPNLCAAGAKAYLSCVVLGRLMRRGHRMLCFVFARLTLLSINSLFACFRWMCKPGLRPGIIEQSGRESVGSRCDGTILLQRQKREFLAAHLSDIRRCGTTVRVALAKICCGGATGSPALHVYWNGRIFRRITDGLSAAVVCALSLSTAL